MADNKKKKNVKKKAPVDKGGAGKSAGRKQFAYHLVPYIFALVALFLLICFISNLFCNPGNELKGGRGDEHTLGWLGFGICYGVFGIFGPAGYVIPILLIVFVIFWKNYNQRSFVAINAVIASITAIVISALIHVFTHMGDGKENFTYDVSALFEEGAELGGGGVIGGLFSYACVSVLNIFGAIFVLIALLIPMVMFLCGTTPVEVASWVFNKIKESAASSKDDGEDDEDGEEKALRKQELKAAREAERLAKKEERAAIAAARSEERDTKAAAEEKTARAAADKTKNDDEKPVIPNDIKTEEKNEEKDDAPALTLNAFSTEEKEHIDGFKSVKVVDDLDEDEREAENIFPKDAEADEDADDAQTVVFVDPKAAPKKDASATLDDMMVDLFDGDEKIRVNKETGEVIEEPQKAIKAVEPEYAEYNYPPLDLLVPGPSKYSTDPEEIEQNSQQLQRVLQDFRIPIKDITCSCGPTITRYEIKPEAGVRVKQIANLVDDISMALARSGVRIEAPIPGKAAVGIEVPNEKPSAVKLRNLIETPEFTGHKSKLASCLGADVSGNPVVFDIEKMPHLLVAGTTGSGKSVCINSIIMSILYHAKPSEVKLLLIDPKKVEFKIYKDIPHLCCRIISDPKKAAGALNSAVNEMEKRFELIEEVGVRNITGYNEATKNDPDKPYMPRMVIIIDEFADLMMTAKDEVETAVVRIAQKARAAGIHLIVGTQRPSVDVITGLIKANIPSRIAFTVMSQVDSRTILDGAGAEKLCGRGDMLYAPVGASKPQRVQGAFVSDDEVEAVVEYVKAHNSTVIYDQEFETAIENEAAKCGNAPEKSGGGDFKGGAGEDDPKLYDAAELAIDAGKISTSLLQRRLEVGYGRAAKIIDRLEEMGFVGPADGNKPRKILITREELAERMMNND